MSTSAIKIILIAFSVLAVLMVIGFAIWVAVSGPAKKNDQAVKGVEINQDELIRQLEHSVFGDPL